jgi:hypothetical protein
MSVHAVITDSGFSLLVVTAFLWRLYMDSKESKKLVIAQKWEESELGFGFRPDGYSLHLTHEDRKAFVGEYWAAMPEKLPNIYSRPTIKRDGSACAEQIPVGIETYEKIRRSKNGIFIGRIDLCG